MFPDWYLVVGIAKTGTTAVATALRNTVRVTKFCVEPTDMKMIQEAGRGDRLVVKIIFDHWKERAAALAAFVCNPVGDYSLTTVAIVRDPRDEAVSRLHYAAFDFFASRSTTEQDRADWMEIFRRKEAMPDRIGLIDMQNELMQRFGRGFLPTPDLHQIYQGFIDQVTTSGAMRTYLLRYEDFVHRTIPDETLRALLAAGRDVHPIFQRVLRTGSSGEWQSFLTDRDLAELNSRYEPYLRRFDFPLQRTGRLRPPARATGSDYVAKLIDEARREYDERQKTAPADSPNSD